MSTYNTYIGARYVPLLVGDWDTTKQTEYEPLTVVQYQGNSYTSRTYVPKNIDITNTEYWVVTGNYNAQVEKYRQEVIEVNNNLKNLRKRRYIVLGDSFGAGIDGNNPTSGVDGGGWLSRFKALFPSDVYSTVVPRAGVSGFASSAPFLQQLKDTEEQIDEPFSITDIVVMGGYNDYPHIGDMLTDAINAFIDYAKSTFPNATITIGCIGTDQQRLYNVVPYYKKCLLQGCVYMPLTNLMTDYIGSDGVHLSQEGYTFYQPYITEAILTRCGDFSIQYSYNIPDETYGALKLITEVSTYRARQYVTFSNVTGWTQFGANITASNITTLGFASTNFNKILPKNTVSQVFTLYELNESSNYASTPIGVYGLKIANDNYIRFDTLSNMCPSFGGTSRTVMNEIIEFNLIG